MKINMQNEKFTSNLLFRIHGTKIKTNFDESCRRILNSVPENEFKHIHYTGCSVEEPTEIFCVLVVQLVPYIEINSSPW